MPIPPRTLLLPRRHFLLGSLSALALPSCAGQCGSPGVVTPEAARPTIPFGVQTGDPTASGVVLWSKTDRPARLFVEWGTDERLSDARKLEGPVATAENDFTARVELTGLPAGKRIHYRVVFEADDAGHARSEPAVGSLRAPPGPGEDVKIVWSGDTAGQGFGIDVDRGGMKTYASIARLAPDLFIHSGDRIYADNPLPEEIKLDDGSVWKNLVTPAKSKVAETLEEFRGNFAYNFLDEHVRRLHAAVPTIVQWDDHEVRNNWFPGQVLSDPRYKERRASVLAAFAKQAMFEYAPMRQGPVHRVLSYGPRVDVFVLDARTFRGSNGPNREEKEPAVILGQEQIAWLKEALARSVATWKIIACDQPIGLVIPDGPTAQEGFANGEGPPLGRELEIASILSFLQEKRIRNVLWITADVHYAAAHHYDPSRAKFAKFDPFWELVAGPLHAGTFGPAPLDETFGPEVKFQNRKQGDPPVGPAGGKQSFGVLAIDGKSGQLRASLHDGDGSEMWGVEIEAVS
ncbi:alkaline phosphatase D family protein [Polyangium jinanense]|uniref:Alkaline phosphatase D family protein n=1 Tax=Polyangium jinanense TaxID=2829994 RepID=A0A9X3X9T4_9BACT|nr:alkaline phosphatase D family protein [Polyangium jinanense]MDC3956720.1 alkaline phosphatase D family protein [Polyangium jinanense]MDC3984783.1 alkaline phosphatase D family protein [Polyangium jinanense]